jgi:hypothetical protein
VLGALIALFLLRRWDRGILDREGLMAETETSFTQQR